MRRLSRFVAWWLTLVRPRASCMMYRPFTTASVMPRL